MSEGSITEIMKNAMGANWTKTDDFAFIFLNKSRPITINSSGMSVQSVYDISVVNIDLPQLGSNVETVLIGGEWRIYNAKFEPFSFSITFRDFGSLELRNYFSAVWMDAQRGYFDKVKSTVKISAQGGVLFESDDCLITSVSQVQLDNSNSQIVEFSVEFTSPYLSNSSIKNFGSDAYRNESSSSTSPLGSALSSVGLGGVGSALSSGESILGSVRSITSTVGGWL